MLKILIIRLLIFLSCLALNLCEIAQVDPQKTLVWGDGLKPDEVVLPARYFFIHAAQKDGKLFEESPPLQFNVEIKGKSPHGPCRSSINVIDRGDGSSIVRYNIADWCDHVEIDVRYNGTHAAQSPYYVRNKVYSETCSCPVDLNLWLLNNQCNDVADEKQITWDLHSFKRVNFSAIRENLLKRYNQPESVSLCHYIVKSQQIWRKCYGKHVGFKMFMDATLLALRRVVQLPDMEFYMNLGDWPLSKKGGQQRTSGPYPIFSWCGSDDSYDIVLPTYDITESTLENMRRVTLDILSVQRSKYPWNEKIEKIFFRGRDSSRERLEIVQLAKKYPDLIDAALTNFFFFRDEEHKYGPKVPIISFMDFFKYKYQLSIDGTVAAYRLPYLLAGGSLLFKQDSPYYEHFYSKMQPYKHFIPVKRDLSDLTDKLQMAKENERQAKEIVRNARKFVEENLMPKQIYCYHMNLFKEWSQRLVSPIVVLPGMEKVEQHYTCSCQETHFRDEL